MDFSAANTSLWSIVIQLGMIAGAILVANLLRQKVPFIRKSLMPTAVLAGFLLLILKYLGVLPVDNVFYEMLVYHCIALGFIAMSLRVVKKGRGKSGDMTGLKSGALIVSTYLVQAVTGLVITLVLAYTFMPDLFKAAGLLLPMGYGQGPGQGNNVGSTYEALGFAGGRSFGLAIAAAGYICACIVGVIMLNVLAKRGEVQPKGETKAEDLSVTTWVLWTASYLAFFFYVVLYAFDPLVLFMNVYGMTMSFVTLLLCRRYGGHKNAHMK